MWRTRNRAVAGNFVLRRMLMARDSSTCGKRVIDLASRDGELRVFMVAGEVSGDSIAARLMASLKRISPFPVRFSGIGGVLMNQEGLHSLFPMEEISVMGIFELLPYLNKIRIKLKETIEATILFQPHVVVTIDSKGFSFRLLKHLKARYNVETDCPIFVHYVAPSFWAWKGGEQRLGKLCDFVDYMLCILPFEEEICRLNGLAAAYVGHPLLEDALHLNSDRDTLSNNWRYQGNGDAFRQQHGIPPENTVITMLPGSRLQEVKRMLPIFLKTVELLSVSFTQLTIIIPVAPHQHVETYMEREINSCSLSAILIPGMSLQQRYDAFSFTVADLFHQLKVLHSGK